MPLSRNRCARCGGLKNWVEGGKNEDWCDCDALDPNYDGAADGYQAWLDGATDPIEVKSTIGCVLPAIIFLLVFLVIATAIWSFYF